MTSARQRAFLVLKRRKIFVKSAAFGIHLQTEAFVKSKESWLYSPAHLEARYWLSVLVDKWSGEDGRPAPQAEVIPGVLAAKQNHVLPAQMSGLLVKASASCEAWFGNDAPALENNLSTFGA